MQSIESSTRENSAYGFSDVLKKMWVKTICITRNKGFVIKLPKAKLETAKKP